MPKKKLASIAGVAPLPEEGFLRETPTALTLTERQELRAFYGSELWKKVWRNALTLAPSSNIPDGNPQLTGILANNRFHQMQGWEKFRRALADQIQEAPQRPPRPVDDYSQPLEIEPKK